MKIDYIVVGARIRKYRLERGITQEDLAFQINTSAAYISNIERGIKRPSLQKLVEIAYVFSKNIFCKMYLLCTMSLSLFGCTSLFLLIEI